MRKYILLFLLLFGCITLIYAQPKQLVITGSVTINDAVAPGVTIHLKHANKSTVTGSDGKFIIVSPALNDTIEIDEKDMQYFSLPINANTAMPLLIKLAPSTKALDEVTINTGYQKIPKERSTGSFTQISKSLLNQQSGTTLLDRLESISNGLYFDRQTGLSGATKIIIRGLSTIQGPSAPLIILDNFPYEGNLDDINPNDVESVTILKDAAAASIWGTRAGNGVIVITTKRGRFNMPTKIEFGSSVLQTKQPDLGYVKNISPADMVGVEHFLYDKGFYANQLAAQPYSYATPVVETLLQRDLGNITAAQANAQLTAIGSHNLLDDMRRYVYKTGVNNQNSLSISGGSKDLAWNFSGGYDRNNDVLAATYKRYSFRNNEVFKINRKLDISVGINYTQSMTEAGRLSYTSLRPNQGILPSYTRLAEDNGNPLAVNYKYRQAYTDTVAGGKLLDWKWYPLTDQQSINNKTNIQALLGDIGIDYKLTKAFGLSVKYQYGKQLTSTRTEYGMGSYYTRNLINQYSVIDPASGKISYNIPKGSILDEAVSELVTHNVRGQVSFNKVFRQHRIDAIAGAEYRSVDNDYTENIAYGYDPNTLLTGVVDQVTQFPNILTGATSNIPGGMSVSGTANRNISFYSNAAYTYKGKYTLSASARRDASNLYGAATNNKWTPLWSTGGSWDIGKEKFYHFKALPALKLRMSYGVSGNADPLRSAVTVIQYNAVSNYTQLPIAILWQYANPSLRWEQVAMTNVGVDFTSRNTRLSGSLEYYHKKGTDLFGTSPVDYTGFATNSIIKNVAKIAAHGWDINLNSRNTVGKVQWNSQLNLNFNKDKVLQYYLVSKQGSNFVSGTSVSAIEGRPVYALYDYKWTGLDPTNGDPIGMLNGTASKDYSSITGSGTQISDLDYIGPTLPTIVATLGNTVSWKRLALTFRITGKFGNYFQRTSIDYTQLFTYRNGHSDFAQRWQNPGDEQHTSIPSMVYPNNSDRNNFYNNAAVLATKADLIRFQYLSFSYELRKSAIRVYMNANNLGLIWKANHYGIDPEYQSIIPPAANFAFGFNATF